MTTRTKGKKICIIKWYDACSKQASEDELKAIENIVSGKELLVINTTYGKIFKEFEDVVVIMTEDSTSDTKEITIIPKGWIIPEKKNEKRKQIKRDNRTRV